MSVRPLSSQTRRLKKIQKSHPRGPPSRSTGRKTDVCTCIHSRSKQTRVRCQPIFLYSSSNTNTQDDCQVQGARRRNSRFLCASSAGKRGSSRKFLLPLFLPLLSFLFMTSHLVMAQLITAFKRTESWSRSSVRPRSSPTSVISWSLPATFASSSSTSFANRACEKRKETVASSFAATSTMTTGISARTPPHAQAGPTLRPGTLRQRCRPHPRWRLCLSPWGVVLLVSLHVPADGCLEFPWGNARRGPCTVVLLTCSCRHHQRIRRWFLRCAVPVTGCTLVSIATSDAQRRARLSKDDSGVVVVVQTIHDTHTSVGTRTPGRDEFSGPVTSGV